VEEDLTTTRLSPRLLTLGAAFVFLAAACSSPASSGAPVATGPGGSGATGGPAAFAPDQALVDAAKAEGELNTIALPRDWCNYASLIDKFNAKFSLKYNGLVPDAGSGQEIEAVKNNPNGGPAAPDVIDVGYSFGPTAKTDGLLQAYKVKTWDTIPADKKDADGFWWADYYGVLSFEVNTDIVKDVPKDWKDLLKPGMKVALAGNPTNSNQAIQTVFAASLANGGSLDNAQPGLDFFKQLVQAGNFVPTVAKQGSLVSGETPIIITWNYLATADKVALEGTLPVEVVIPTAGRFGGIYVQGISKTAPHPNAAKLWEEWLFSDEGQVEWLRGFCYTSRFDDLKAKGAIPSDLLASLPDVSGAVFPNGPQLDAAKKLVTEQWVGVTGVDTFKTLPPAP
jgi:putative spermidine/putrescine transport system substrate-binding protein